MAKQTEAAASEKQLAGAMKDELSGEAAYSAPVNSSINLDDYDFDPPDEELEAAEQLVDTSKASEKPKKPRDATGKFQKKAAPEAEAEQEADGGDAETDEAEGADAGATAKNADKQDDDEPSGLAAEAIAYGLDPADFPTEAALEKAVIAIERQIAKMGEGFVPANSQLDTSEESANTSAKTQKDSRQPAGKSAEDSADGAAADSHDEEFALPEGEFDPELERVIKGLQGQVKSLKAERDQANAQQAQQAWVEFEQKLDGFFTELGDDFKPLFGDGTMRDLKPDSEAAQNRMRVVKLAENLMRGDAAANRPVRDIKRALQSGLRGEFTEHVEKTQRRQLSKEVEKRRKQAIARPTQRQGRPLSAVERAAAYVDGFIKERGGQDGFLGVEDDLDGDI